MQIGEGQFRDLIAADDQRPSDTDRHEEQRRPEDGVNLADQLVDREHGGEEIVYEYGGHPRRYAQGVMVARSFAGPSTKITPTSSRTTENPSVLLTSAPVYKGSPPSLPHVRIYGR